jgi:hypothetical protein
VLPSQNVYDTSYRQTISAQWAVANQAARETVAAKAEYPGPIRRAWIAARSSGRDQAEAKMKHSVPFRFASYAGMDIENANGLPVVPKLKYAKILPKYFRGTIEKVEFDLGPAKLSAKDLQRIYLQRFANAVRN